MSGRVEDCAKEHQQEQHWEAEHVQRIEQRDEGHCGAAHDIREERELLRTHPVGDRAAEEGHEHGQRDREAIGRAPVNDRDLGRLDLTTGGWQTWTTLSTTVNLSAGTQIMRIVLDSNAPGGGFGNMNWIRVQ